MSDSDEIGYSKSEILSYLPPGWSLVPGETAGRWDPALRVWTIDVQDGSDLEWRVIVRSDQARSMGRLGALQHRLEILKLGGTHRAGRPAPQQNAGESR